MFGMGKRRQVVSGGGSALVPATAFVEFLELNKRKSIHSFECLHKLGIGTRPSMELSATVGEFASWTDFIEFARDAVVRALAIAASESSVAVFEVWFGECALSDEAA